MLSSRQGEIYDFLKVKQRAVSCSVYFLLGAYNELGSSLKVWDSLSYKEMCCISCFWGISAKWKAKCSNLHRRTGK